MKKKNKKNRVESSVMIELCHALHSYQNRVWARVWPVDSVLASVRV